MHVDIRETGWGGGFTYWFSVAARTEDFLTETVTKIKKSRAWKLALDFYAEVMR